MTDEPKTRLWNEARKLTGTTAGALGALRDAIAIGASEAGAEATALEQQAAAAAEQARALRAQAGLADAPVFSGTPWQAGPAIVAWLSTHPGQHSHAAIVAGLKADLGADDADAPAVSRALVALVRAGTVIADGERRGKTYRVLDAPDGSA